jgi:hypothetical protein
MTRTPPRIAGRTLGLLGTAALLPVGVVAALAVVPPGGDPPPLRADGPSRFPASPLPLGQRPLGPGPGHRPIVCNVQITDLDRDGLPDVLACDARRGRVLWYRQAPRGTWTEHALGDRDLPAPCQADVADLDGDGDPDLAVAILGSVWAATDRVGQVAWLENRGPDGFVTHVVLDDLGRVADVRAAELNGDGRVDLVAAEFGFDHGRVWWLENRGGGRFREHHLLTAPGTVHVPPADYDGDGDLDVAALVTQDHEEVWGFENLGGGRFRRRLLRDTLNFDFGSVGLVPADLDRDGKTDLLWVAGDNLEVRYSFPQRWHGCVWLRNLGDWRFEPRRLATLGGAYAAAAGDLDGDGDTDVVLVSMFNDWRQPGGASAVWLENDGRQNFQTWQIADRPIHLATVACGDLNGDGRADVVAGGLHILEPFDRLGRITLWLSREGAP